MKVKPKFPTFYNLFYNLYMSFLHHDEIPPRLIQSIM